MIAIGVDVHKRQCRLAMQFEDGELASFAPIEARARGGWSFWRCCRRKRRWRWRSRRAGTSP